MQDRTEQFPRPQYSRRKKRWLSGRACPAFSPLESRGKPMHRICRRCAQHLEHHKNRPT